MRENTGFSLLELLVVLVMIAILATMAVPAIVSPMARDQVRESLELVGQLKSGVKLYQQTMDVMPADNKEAGIPLPDKLIGNYVKSVELENGAFHIAFGNKAVSLLEGKVLSVRAVSVQGSPESPVAWVCGYSRVPNGMVADAPDRTTVPAKFLPVECREIPTGSSD